MSVLEYNQNQFMADFILQCVKQGKNSVLDICKCAEKEAEQIELEIKRIESLQIKRSKLNNIVRQFKGYHSKDKIIKIDDYPADSLTPNMSEMCIKICDYLAENNQTTPRELMDNVASVDDNFVVYSSIKLLTDNGIIKRSGLERNIIAGDNWKNRPVRNG